MIKLLLHESKRRVGSPGVFITPGTYFIFLEEIEVSISQKALTLSMDISTDGYPEIIKQF